MTSKSQDPKGHYSVLSALDAVIETLNLAKDAYSIPRVQIAFGSVSDLPAAIRVCSPRSPAVGLRFTFVQDTVTNKRDYVELGISCADVCGALDRGLSGRQLDELNQPVLGAIEKLAM